MNAAYVNYYYDPDISQETYFDRYPSVHGWCKAAADSGISVTVYQRFNKDISFEKDNVLYKMICDNESPALKTFENPYLFHNHIIKGSPDLIHINSFNYSFQLWMLQRKIKKGKFIIQHHAEKPLNGIRKNIRRFLCGSSDGFIFSSEPLYKEWEGQYNIPTGKIFAEIIENSTCFVPANKIASQNKTGMTGSPIFLWVGRLNENKDPLTLLTGFRMLLSDHPEAKLYMIYSEGKLEKSIIEYLKSAEMSGAVELSGKIKHSELNAYYNSADYFVSGSHYESSGYSLIEAMACGVIPIVTDIPSFRVITGNGTAGGLWIKGNADSFYNMAKEVLLKDREQLTRKTKMIFDSELSFSAISGKINKFYAGVLSSKV